MSKLPLYDGYQHTAKLLPCPFCGEVKDAPPYMQREKSKSMDFHTYSVACGNCGCEPQYYVETEQEAIDLWNTRISLNKDQSFVNGFNHCKDLINELVRHANVNI